MSLTTIQQVRLLVQDNDVTFPFLSDAEITFFLERNENNVDRTAIEVAKVILLQLSLRSGTDHVDIFTISSKGAALAYRDSLLAFLKNPQLNPLYKGINGYAGGISKLDFITNIENSDNLSVCTPLMQDSSTATFGI